MKAIITVPLFIILLSLYGCGGGSGSGSEEQGDTSEEQNIDEPIVETPEVEEPVDSGDPISPVEPDPITIGEIYTDIWHFHPSFELKWIEPDKREDYANRTIRFGVSFPITDLQGVENLEHIYVQNTDSGFTVDLLGGDSELPIETCYIEAREVFECNLIAAQDLDHIDLKSWQIVVENKQGDIANKAFEFVLPNGDDAGDINFLYTSDYAGSTAGGQLAFEALTINDNDIDFSIDANTQSFHIEFDSLDESASLYSLAFYEILLTPGGFVAGNNIGTVGVNSATLLDNPIISGHKTKFDLPWSEVSLKEGAAINNILGMHIILHDEPVDYLDTEDKWSHYTSISEFTLLTAD